MTTKPPTAEVKDRLDAASRIAELLAALKSQNFTGPFVIEGNANTGGALPDSLRLLVKKRLA